MKKNVKIYFIIVISLICFIVSFFVENSNFYLFCLLSIPFLLYFSLTFHEMGHLFFCKLTGTKIVSFQIFPFSKNNNKKKLFYVEFKKLSKKKANFILLGGIIFTFLLEVLLGILCFINIKRFILILIVNTFVLLGVCFNKDCDLDKIRRKL